MGPTRFVQKLVCTRFGQKLVSTGFGQKFVFTKFGQKLGPTRFVQKLVCTRISQEFIRKVTGGPGMNKVLTEVTFYQKSHTWSSFGTFLLLIFKRVMLARHHSEESQ